MQHFTIQIEKLVYQVILFLVIKNKIKNKQMFYCILLYKIWIKINGGNSEYTLIQKNVIAHLYVRQYFFMCIFWSHFL